MSFVVWSLTTTINITKRKRHAACPLSWNALISRAESTQKPAEWLRSVDDYITRWNGIRHARIQRAMTCIMWVRVKGYVLSPSQSHIFSSAEIILDLRLSCQFVFLPVQWVIVMVFRNGITFRTRAYEYVYGAKWSHNSQFTRGHLLGNYIKSIRTS